MSRLLGDLVARGTRSSVHAYGRGAVVKVPESSTPASWIHYHEPINLFVAGFIGSPAMNLVPVGDRRPLKVGGSMVEFDGPADAALAKATGNITVGFRPEALRVGDGPLQAQIRTVEDLGSEVFVHLAVKQQGESLSLVSKMPPPFHGELGDSVGLQITGTTHLLAGDGSRITSTAATWR